MYCPKCAAENRNEQKYCRQCGLSLGSVRLALEGRVDEALKTIEKDLDRLAGGTLTLFIFACIALGIALFGKGGNTINLILGLLIATPAIVSGMIRIHRTIGVLTGKQDLPGTANDSAGEASRISAPSAVAELPPVPDTDEIPLLSGRDSVTDHTTLELKSPKS